MSTLQEQRQACIEKAKKAIEDGTLDIGEATKLAKELKDLDEFGYAWRLLERIRQSDEVTKDDALDLRFRQEIALCTYKDTHLNDEYRLVRALEILDQGDHLQDSSNPETLGLAGAIHKRLWQVRQ